MIDTALALESASDPRVGDRVRIPRELLAEVARPSPLSPRNWRLVPAGAAGKVIGWHDADRAAVALDDVVVVVRVASITRL